VSALLGISGPFCPRGRHLKALPRGALFLCLAGCSESLLRDRRTKLSQVSPLAELAIWTLARLALSSDMASSAALPGGRDTGELLSDHLRRLGADARKRVDLVSRGPEPLQGRDASAQGLPRLVRETQPRMGPPMQCHLS
jgi:hypothetical protein